MTFPAFVNSGAKQFAASGTTITPALPASRVNGNLLIAVISHGVVDKTDTFPAGWTALTSQASVTNTSMATAWRIVDGTETAPAITWTGSSSAVAQVFQYSGNHPTAPIGHTHTNTNVSASTTASDAGVTLLGTNSLIAVFVGGDTAGGSTIGAATSYTKDVDFVGSGTGGNIAEYSEQKASGSSDAFSATTSASRRWNTASIEIVVSPGTANITASPALGISEAAAVATSATKKKQPVVCVVT